MGEAELHHATELDSPQEPQQLPDAVDAKGLEPLASPRSTASSDNTGVEQRPRADIVEVWNDVEAAKDAHSTEQRLDKPGNSAEAHEESGADSELGASPTEQNEFNPLALPDTSLESNEVSVRPQSSLSPLPSVMMSSAPSSPTASTTASFVGAPQAEASSSRTNLRAPAPTPPAQSSTSLDRRQSRRRSTLGDVRVFRLFPLDFD